MFYGGILPVVRDDASRKRSYGAKVPDGSRRRPPQPKTPPESVPMVYRPLRYEQMMRAGEAYDVRARRMFGGMGVYTGERMFAFLLEDAVGLKLNPLDYAEAMALPGACPMRPEPGAEPMREYVQLPPCVLEDEGLLTLWIERSAEYVRNRGANGV